MRRAGRDAVVRTLTGTGKLIRLIVRRDRVVAPLWILFVGVVPTGFVSSFKALYPTAASRQQFAATTGHDGTFVAGLQLLYFLAVADQCRHYALSLFGVVAEEFGGTELFAQRKPNGFGRRFARTRP